MGRPHSQVAKLRRRASELRAEGHDDYAIADMLGVARRTACRYATEGVRDAGIDIPIDKRRRREPCVFRNCRQIRTWEHLAWLDEPKAKSVVASLTASQRRLFNLLINERYTLGDIADVEGITLRAVSYRLRRMRAIFRDAGLPIPCRVTEHAFPRVRIHFISHYLETL